MILHLICYVPHFRYSTTLLKFGTILKFGTQICTVWLINEITLKMFTVDFWTTHSQKFSKQELLTNLFLCSRKWSLGIEEIII